MAVHKENIVMAALDLLVVDDIDMGATFEPMLFSTDIETEDINNETSRTSIDSDITGRTFRAEVTLAEVKLANLAVVLSFPTANVVSSASMLVLNSGERGLVKWLAIGKNRSAPNGGTRAFNFPRARSIGTPTYNLAKLEATNIPVEFKFYADRTTADVGTITDTENFLMIFDTARSSQIDLGGLVTIESIYTAVNQLRVTLVRVVYDEATSSHTGTLISVGKIGNDSFFASMTSEINKAAGSVTTMTLSNVVLSAGETMTVKCNGTKAGTGAVTVQVELEAWT